MVKQYTGDEKTDIWSPDCHYLTQITDRKVCYLGARFLAALQRKLSNIWPDSCWNYLIKHCVPWGLARYERQTSQIRETLYPDCWTCTRSIRHDQQIGDTINNTTTPDGEVVDDVATTSADVIYSYQAYVGIHVGYVLQFYIRGKGYLVYIISSYVIII